MEAPYTSRRTVAAGLVGFVACSNACASGISETGVRTGLDTAAATGFAALAGKRTGLVSNQTGVDCRGRRNLDLMRAAGVDVRAIFAPEHGYWGAREDDLMQAAVDPTTGIRIHSLYDGDTRRPRQEWLRELDAIVFDIADVGARFYTYITTLGYVMEEAARAGVAVHVFDRPNPITGHVIEGPMLDSANISFVGYSRLPVRHGMTIGELAALFNTSIGASLHVSRMRGWRRTMWFDETGLNWINPSPNMRGPQAALLYPGLALLELDRQYSVGRGTPCPFEQIGTTYIEPEVLARAMEAEGPEGVYIRPVEFVPASGPLAGRTARGLRLQVSDRGAFRSVAFGLTLAAVLQRLYPGAVDFSINRRLIGSDAIVEALSGGESARTVLAMSDDGLENFARLRRRHLIYD